MKKYYFLCIILLLFSACDDISHSDLVGKWQLRTVEKNGVETKVDTVWYSFQSKSLFMLQVYQAPTDTVLELYGFRAQPDKKTLSIELDCPVNIDYTDWSDINRTFKIDKLTGSKLVLSSDEGYVYSFIKF